MNNDTEEPSLITTPGERTVAIAAHAGALFLWLMPLLNAAIPLVIWLQTKQKHTFAAKHAAAAFNFHLPFGILYAVAFWAHFALATHPIAPVLELWIIVTSCFAAMRASFGKLVIYPLTPFRILEAGSAVATTSSTNPPR